jgi:MoxR-like ATPase
MRLQAEFEGLVASAKANLDIERQAEEVRTNYGPMFTPAGISALDPEMFKAFLLFENNHHWSAIHRWGGRLTANLPLLRQALLVIVDEAKPVSDRIDEARGMVNGLGEAIISAILQVAYPTKYGVYNAVSEEGLENIGLFPRTTVPGFDSLSTGKRYELVNRVLNGLSTNYTVSLWALDTIWGGLPTSKESGPSGSRPEAPSAWWVNQGATYQAGRDGGFLWAPKLGRDGRSREYWLNLKELTPCDIVLHYVEGNIRAVSRVATSGVDQAKPASLASEDWASDGILARTTYRELETPIKVTDIPTSLRVPDSGPFTATGGVKQGYIFPLSNEFYDELCRLHPEILTELPTHRTTEALSEIATTDYIEPPWDTIRERVSATGIKIPAEVLERYHLSLRVRHFVILSGVSGTGKTWLAQAYAEAVGAKLCHVSVAPNWNTNEDLLGYYNPLQRLYVDTPFSLFLREASAEWSKATGSGKSPKPYHLLLDEMNLARVEYYFAQFLSVLESRPKDGVRTIKLSQTESVSLGSNLFVIGTVNIDETTHGFSDKVYDRAQLIELPIDRQSIREHLEQFPYADLVTELWDRVKDVAPFAYRVIDDIHSYVLSAEAMGEPWEKALDAQIVQKILPKLNRADPRVATALKAFEEVLLPADKFPLSLSKAKHMLDGYNANGYSSFF